MAILKEHLFFTIRFQLIIFLLVLWKPDVTLSASSSRDDVTEDESTGSSSGSSGWSPTSVSGSGISDEYCLTEWFNASCGRMPASGAAAAGSVAASDEHQQHQDPQQDSVIIMTRAQYGRMKQSRCIQMKYGQDVVGCRADVMAQLDGECSGRTSCRFSVSRLVSSVTPCGTDLMSYLEATYSCVKVSRGVCTMSERHKLLTAQSGYISPSLLSAASEASRPSLSAGGTQRCPWRIVLDAQQHIRVILYMFGNHGHVTSSSDRGVQGQNRGVCPVSVVFDSDVEKSLCQSAGARQVLLYTSASNQISIFFKFQPQADPLHQQQLVGSFLLYYEAIGCPSLKIPSADGSTGVGAWVVRQDAGTAVVKCNATEEMWYLRCDGRQWKGDIGNCTIPVQAATPNDAEPRLSPAASSLSFGLIMAVVIGVLLGVVIGAVPLGLAYVCLKRKWYPATRPDGYMHGSSVGGGTDEDFYDPATGGKVALMSAANCRSLPPHIQQLVASGGGIPTHSSQLGGGGMISCGPPGYYDEGVVVESITGNASYPFHHVVHHQPYCAATGPGRTHQQHSPSCYTATDLTDPTILVGRGDFLDCSGGVKSRLEHIYESASFGGFRGGNGTKLARHQLLHNVPSSDEHYLPATPLPSSSNAGTAVGLPQVPGATTLVTGSGPASAPIPVSASAGIEAGTCPLHFMAAGNNDSDSKITA